MVAQEKSARAAAPGRATGSATGNRLARIGCVAAFVGALAGCALNDPAYNLPETADVEDAPWPRLVDAPPPISQSGENLAELTRRGVDIETNMGAEAATLLRRDAEMRSRQVVDPSLYRRADRIRARARAIRAEE